MRRLATFVRRCSCVFYLCVLAVNSQTTWNEIPINTSCLNLANMVLKSPHNPLSGRWGPTSSENVVMCACVILARTVCQALVCGDMPCVIISYSVDHTHLRYKTHYHHCARKHLRFPGFVLMSSRLLLTSYLFFVHWLIFLYTWFR